MGQRLNLEITENNKIIANAYYHWGAFTVPSLKLARTILNNLDTITHDDPVLRAIRLLESTGARISLDELELTQAEYPHEFFALATDREGLISITEEGIEATKDCEEGRVTIDLARKVVDFDVFWVRDKEIFLDDLELAEEDYLALPVLSVDFSQIPFHEFPKVDEMIMHYLQEKVRAFRKESDSVVVLIAIA